MELYLNVNEFGNAGNLIIFNITDNLKYEISLYQPFEYALFKARELSKILKCPVKIDNIIDDGREISVSDKYIQKVESIN